MSSPHHARQSTDPALPRVKTEQGKNPDFEKADTFRAEEARTSTARAYKLGLSEVSRLLLFGVPLKIEDEVVGAVGVSRGENKQDQAVAEAAASVFENLAKKRVA